MTPTTEQFTTEQAIAFAESGAWEKLSAMERATLQINQAKLCMPFDVFHKAITEALGRPVWTHEFGLNWDGLRAELEGRLPAPSLAKIMEMLPPEKTLVITRA